MTSKHRIAYNMEKKTKTKTTTDTTINEQRNKKPNVDYL
jgi:hypothetical protein